MKVGAENIITFHKGIYLFENKHLKPQLFPEDEWYLKGSGIVYRLSKTVFLDNSIDLMSSTLQHEVFGHGARYREFGYVKNSYTIGYPFPYGKGGGLAVRGKKDSGDNEDYHFSLDVEYLTMITGGYEANTILSRRLLFKWLYENKINYRETLLYLKGFSFILQTIYKERYLESYKSLPNRSDIYKYLFCINHLNGNITNDNQLTINDLCKQVLINFLDPFQYYAIYALCIKYGYQAKENFTFPMIRFGDKLGYLPSFSFCLSPFGSEYYIENYLKYDKKLFSMYLRYGNQFHYYYYGLGIQGDNLIQMKYFSLAANLDLWYQPQIASDRDSYDYTREKPGFSIGIEPILHYKNVGLHSEIKYKSDGYMRGEQLKEGVIWRIGIGFF